MKYFEERINEVFKRLYQESVATHGWCVEISDMGMRFGVDLSTTFTVEEAKEMVEWINKNLPKKVYVLHKEFNYNPVGKNGSCGAIVITKGDVKEEYR